MPPSIIAVPGGTTVNIRDYAGVVQYSVNNQASWNNIEWPCGVQNTNTSIGDLIINFVTNIEIINASYYFFCMSDRIQFGRKLLNNRPTITVSGVTDYPGLVQNFSGDNVSICNLNLTTNAGSKLATNGGWFGQANFGTGASNNYIVNCHSSGVIDGNFCGGIVGTGVASSAGRMVIRGCSSSGTISGTGSGGITADRVGLDRGTVTIESCWSSGDITGANAGGIVGYKSGENAGNIGIGFCYSTGLIGGLGAGGIVGGNIGFNALSVRVVACYTNGGITGANAGGICGAIEVSGTDNIVGSLLNLYTTGLIHGDVNAGGIVGRVVNTGSGTVIVPPFRCYTSGANVGANGFIVGGSPNVPYGCYAESANGGAGWMTSHANTVLEYMPASEPGAGEVWVSTGVNVPYELFSMGYTPYTTQVIDATWNLVRVYRTTVRPGASTIPAVIPGTMFSILGGGRDTIQIDADTGKVSTTNATPVGTYNVIVRYLNDYDDGHYNVCKLVLTVAIPNPVPETPRAIGFGIFITPPEMIFPPYTPYPPNK